MNRIKQISQNKACDLNDPAENIAYIDAIRVFAAVLVVTLHCLSYSLTQVDTESALWWVTGLVSELTRVGVPLFFMISGYLIMGSDKTRRPGQFYKKRIRKLMIPFLVWNFIYYSYYRLAEKKPFWSFDFVSELFCTGSGYHLWFIYSMLIVCLFMPFVKLILDAGTRRMQWLFFLLVIMQTTLKPTLNLLLGEKLYLYFAEDGMIGYLGYAVLGWLLGSSKISGKQSRPIYLLGGIVFFAAARINCMWAAEGRGFLLNGGYTINHYIEASAVFLLFQNRCTRHFPAAKRLSNACMTVYFVHVLIIECIMRYLYPGMKIKLSVFVYLLAAAAVLLSFGFAVFWETIKKYLKCDRGEIICSIIKNK